MVLRFLQVCKRLFIQPKQFSFSRLISSTIHINKMKYLGQVEAQSVDEELFNEYKFSVDQLMEMAGLSCAQIIYHAFPIETLQNQGKVIVFCGPGNNGGDGLVCARHLLLFGYKPEVFYPKPTAKPLYQALEHQCRSFGIPVSSNLPNTDLGSVDLYVDALFGFSFKPPVRESFVPILNALVNTSTPVCSVDIPSGWEVEGETPGALRPDVLISLTAPKLCAQHFSGKHYLAGRFVPSKLAEKYKLEIPAYKDSFSFQLLP